MSNSAICAVRDYSEAVGPRRLVLVMIAEAIDQHTGYARGLSRDLLARRCRIEVHQLSTYLGDLVADGELVILRTRPCQQYAIPLYSQENGYNPEPCTVSDPRHVCSKNHTSLEVDRVPIRSGGRPRTEVANMPKVAHMPPEAELPKVAESPTVGGNFANHKVAILPTIGGNFANNAIYPINPILSHSIPMRASAREAPSISQNNLALAERDAEPEPQTLPPVAVPPLPDVPEARLAWKEVRSSMARKVGLAVVSSWGTQCHLYALGPDQWQLRLGAGVPVGMFRARFQELLADELCRFAKKGNQVLEIVGGG